MRKSRSTVFAEPWRRWSPPQRRAPVAESWSRDPGTGTARAKARMTRLAGETGRGILFRFSLDDGHRRSAHAEQFRVRVFDFNANRESLRDVNPVQLALHVRQTVRNIDLVGWLDRPADSLYLTDKATRRHGGEIDLHRSARRHVANLAFAKICDDVPLARVQQREHGNASARVRARRDVQADDPARKWSSDFAVGKFERGKVHRGDCAGALRDQRARVLRAAWAWFNLCSS